MMKCSNCGSENDYNAKYCSECGNNITPFLPRTKCRKCKAELPDRFNFCPECGSKILIPCPGCGCELRAGKTECRVCGSPAGFHIPETVFIKGGTFMMGNKKGDEREQPVHSVTVGSFRIGKYAVTFRDYDAFCEETGREKPDDEDMGIRENRPVINVSWDDAKAYCEWLSGITGRKYDLPTEAEWEFAARGGILSHGHRYSGSGNINDVGNYRESVHENQDVRTMPVGSFRPNELGLYDMSGNVWEWCSDWYYKNYYRESPENDPAGPAEGEKRVIRGGSYDILKYFCRVSCRSGSLPGTRSRDTGFRCVERITPEEEEYFLTPAMAELVHVEGGTFMMGSDEGENNEKPAHPVTLKSFSIGKYPVTFKEFNIFCEATRRKLADDWNVGEWEENESDRWPVFLSIDWEDARKYCEWLSSMTGKKYDLPTEAQWEYAARGGSLSKGYKYSGSDNIDEVAWYLENSSHWVHPAGEKKPNELGIYDMTGNVCEWCLDLYDENYYSVSPEKDPAGPSEGDRKVIRGGDLNSSVYGCRITKRDKMYPFGSSPVDPTGFRVVRLD